MSTHREEWRGARLALVPGIALLVTLPNTLPVSVLREFVHDRFDVSEFATSLFMVVNMIGAVFAAPLAGMLSDRFGRRRATVAAALVLDGVCFLALTWPMSYGAFLAVRFLEGVSHITALSVLMALAADSQSDARRGRVMGLVGAGMTLGIALGAPLGGALGKHDVLLPLQVGGIVSIAAGALAWFALRDVASHSHRPTLREMARAIAADRPLLAPLAFALIDRFTVGFYTTTFSLYLRRIHGFDPSQIGLLLAAFLLPFSLLSYPFGRLSERTSRTRLVVTGSVAYGLGTASLGWWPSEGLPGLMLFLGVTSAVMFVPSLMLTTDLAGERMRGTAIGAFNAAGSLGFILGPLVGGALSEWIAASSGWEAGYRAAFATAGLSELLCVVLTLPILRALRRAGRTT